jgi:hypothetical protein
MANSTRRKKWRPSWLVVALILCNLFQTAALGYNYFVLQSQRDIIRYLFQRAFENDN